MPVGERPARAELLPEARRSGRAEVPRGRVRTGPLEQGPDRIHAEHRTGGPERRQRRARTASSSRSTTTRRRRSPTARRASTPTSSTDSWASCGSSPPCWGGPYRSRAGEWRLSPARGGAARSARRAASGRASREERCARGSWPRSTRRPGRRARRGACSRAISPVIGHTCTGPSKRDNFRILQIDGDAAKLRQFRYLPEHDSRHAPAAEPRQQPALSSATEGPRHGMQQDMGIKV